MVTQNKKNVWNVMGSIWFYSALAAIAGMAQRMEQGPVMTTDLSHESERDDRSVRRRKVRALLAGGLVLGVGAAVTLAAWTDNVFGQAEFGAANWNVQGDFSRDAAEWNEYETEGTAGSFDYTTGYNALSPGTTVYAPVALRVGKGTTAGGAYDATVTLNGATGGGGALTQYLTYSVLSGVSKADCVSGTTTGGTPFVGEGSALTTGSGSTTLRLPASGIEVPLCFAVTMSPTVAASAAAGATTGPLTWEFDATAVVP